MPAYAESAIAAKWWAGAVMATGIGRGLNPAIAPDYQPRPVRWGSGSRLEGPEMRSWLSQIVIGIIVAVIGTVIADVITKGGVRKHFGIGSHYGGVR